VRARAPGSCLRSTAALPAWSGRARPRARHGVAVPPAGQFVPARPRHGASVLFVPHTLSCCWLGLGHAPRPLASHGADRPAGGGAAVLDAPYVRRACHRALPRAHRRPLERSRWRSATPRPALLRRAPRLQAPTHPVMLLLWLSIGAEAAGTARLTNPLSLKPCSTPGRTARHACSAASEPSLRAGQRPVPWVSVQFPGVDRYRTIQSPRDWELSVTARSGAAVRTRALCAWAPTVGSVELRAW